MEVDILAPRQHAGLQGWVFLFIFGLSSLVVEQLLELEHTFTLKRY